MIKLNKRAYKKYTIIIIHIIITGNGYEKPLYYKVIEKKICCYRYIECVLKVRVDFSEHFQKQPFHISIYTCIIN